MLKDKSETSNKEITDEEMKDAIVNIFNFADEIESMYNTMVEDFYDLNSAIKTQDINEEDITGGE